LTVALTAPEALAWTKHGPSGLIETTGAGRWAAADVQAAQDIRTAIVQPSLMSDLPSIVIL
jgi:hypothetical protein